MHLNHTPRIQKLPDGSVVLLWPEGTPACFDSSGRLRRTLTGEPMVIETRPQAPTDSAEKDLIKLPLQHYSAFVAEHFSPRLNLRTQQIEINGVEISEEEFEAIHIYSAEKLGHKVRKADLQAAIRATSWRAKYDPLYTYLDGLARDESEVLSEADWDSVAAQSLGLPDSWARTVVQKFLIACVARVMDPGCKVDFCLILFGPQGLGKSTFFEKLSGEYFSDSMGDLTNKKDDLLVLHKNWLCEWSEADQIFAGAHRSEQIKRFVSSTEDTFRAPYGRTTQSFKRRSILCGTTNRDDWANDPTGNRRFPVLSPTAIDTEWIEANRDAIWGRAVAEYRKGMKWWFTKEEEARVSEQAALFAPTNDDVEIAHSWLKTHSGEWVSTRDLMTEALGIDREKLDHRKVSGFARQMSGLKTRGVLKEVKNYTNKTSLSVTRIRTTCWMVPCPNE